MAPSSQELEPPANPGRFSAREATLFRLSMAGAFQREQVQDWLNTAVDDGRAELQAQHALEREVDAWDMSCRIMFMVRISG
jgi:hypothetical protein